MRQYIFKLPDLGEGTVEAEIVAWHAHTGDYIDEDSVVLEVMTDKAAVEVPSPVSGRVLSITGAAGDKIAVGSPLIVFEMSLDPAKPSPAVSMIPFTLEKALPQPLPIRITHTADSPSPPAQATGEPSRRIMTSPAIRRRAQEAGLDLSQVVGSGPGGRIVMADLFTPPPVTVQAPGTTEIKVIGIRRIIAERMSEAKRTIPHFSFVEEVDVTELESLRRHLNDRRAKETSSLTLLPFVIAALCPVLRLFPQCNVLYDVGRGVLVRHERVHVGVATQTPDGLKVPVVRDVQLLTLSGLAAAVKHVTELARSNKASREHLSGSTITVTSLGKLGGIASTPIINAPEVAIIGLNKAVERPVVRDNQILTRHMMNLSSSFDHRFIDGFDAAAMIQELKRRLEHPATIFM